MAQAGKSPAAKLAHMSLIPRNYRRGLTATSCPLSSAHMVKRRVSHKINAKMEKGVL